MGTHIRLPIVDLHTGEGLPDSRTFFIPAAKWRARACLDVYGRTESFLPLSLFLSDISRESVRINEIIVHERNEERGAKFHPDNCHGAEKYKGYLVREHRCDLW